MEGEEDKLQVWVARSVGKRGSAVCSHVGHTSFAPRWLLGFCVCVFGKVENVDYWAMAFVLGVAGVFVFLSSKNWFQFSIATVTNYCRFGILKQYSLWSCSRVGQKSNADPTRLKSGSQQGCSPGGGSRGSLSHCPSSFQRSFPLACGPVFRVGGTAAPCPFSCGASPWLPSLSPSSTLKDLVLTLGPLV